jgi:hypothetical protein
MKFKSLSVAALVILFAPIGLSDHTADDSQVAGIVGDQTVTYSGVGSDGNLVIEDASFDQFGPHAYRLFVSCGSKRYRATIKNFDQNDVTNQATPGHDTEYIFRDIFPEQIPCSIGSNYKVNMTIWSNPLGSPDTLEYYSTGTVDVVSGMSNPNKGYHIVSRHQVRPDPDKASKARDFFLTDEPWYDNEGVLEINEFPDRDGGKRPVEKGAFFLISEADTEQTVPNKGDNGIYIAQYGNIIRSFDQSLGDHVLARYTKARGGPQNEGWSITGRDPVAHIQQSLNREFDENYIKEYGKNGEGGCHVYEAGTISGAGYEWGSNCAPLHNNGVYEPQGEIIVASEPDTSFADRSDRPLSISPKTHFYVCRNHPSNSEWQGTEPSNSKVVKVQKKVAGNLVDEWKYYHCNTFNDWDEIDCPPGQEVDRESGELRCADKDPVTVEVDFFNMSSVPRPSGAAGDELIAGFKISPPEIRKYENLMDQELQRIDAECWMGDDDRYPGDHDVPNDETGTFSLNYDNIGSGDAWVLGKIPYRRGVNNQTYSCVWGFGPQKQVESFNVDGPVYTESGVYESTKYRPLRSVEGDRIDVNYTKTIQPEYANLAKPSELKESVDRTDLWTPYSSEDTRSYVSSIEEDMFSYSNAFPYCTTPTSPSSILAEVICS